MFVEYVFNRLATRFGSVFGSGSSFMLMPLIHCVRLSRDCCHIVLLSIVGFLVGSLCTNVSIFGNVLASRMYEGKRCGNDSLICLGINASCIDSFVDWLQYLSMFTILCFLVFHVLYLLKRSSKLMFDKSCLNGSSFGSLNVTMNSGME